MLLLTGAAMAAIEWGGQATQFMARHKKRMTIAFIAITGLFVYSIFKYSPAKGRNMLLCAGNMIRYMPLNRQTADVLTHVLDMTGNQAGMMHHINGGLNPGHLAALAPPAVPEPRVRELPPSRAFGGQRRFKRSVSETKKKYVASSQNWRCAHCGKQLDHTFEIDHKVRLQDGGSNDVSQLEALCPGCHRLKTARENM